MSLPRWVSLGSRPSGLIHTQDPPRRTMFKKLKQKISEEEQKFQHTLVSTQVPWLPPSPSSDTS